MFLGNSAELSGRRRDARLARLAARIQEINERRPKTALKSGGMLVIMAIERRWARLSLACWRLEAQTEMMLHPLRAVAIPLEVFRLSFRGPGPVSGGG